MKRISTWKKTLSSSLIPLMLMGGASLDVAAEEQFEGGTPGPRNCLFRRGPHSADPYINSAYPDANVYYWAAVFTMPEGSKLTLNAEFAHSRYQSLISYDEKGVPQQSLADYLIKPEKGAVNPYRIGADRQFEQRDFKVEVLPVAPDKSKETIGTYQERAVFNKTSNTIAAPINKTGQQILLYRIYLPDEGTAPTGGVSLPTPELTLKSGKVLNGEEACNALNTNAMAKISADAIGIPVSKYRMLVSQPDKPDTWPAKEKPEWHIQLDRKALLGIYTGEIDPDARRSEGGFFPNLDNQYVRTVINRRHGKVLMLRGKMPTTPRTYYGDEKAQGDTDMRYWSICSNQSFANTRVNDCLFDEEVPLDKNGFYTIAVSRAEDRPRNAVKRCGIAWLPMADDGDGMFDEDVSIVQIRNMLSNPEFKQGIINIQKDGDIEKVMGPYLPKGFYIQPNIMESLFPCDQL